MSDDILDRVFGADSRGATAEERAKTSKVIFIRSQDELSLYREGAQGRQLSACEALKTFGLDVLEEVFFEGSAILVDSKEEPARTFKARREALGLTVQEISRALNLSEDKIKTIEDPNKRNLIRDLELIAENLGLDERKITFERGLKGDNYLALRLKTLQEDAQLKPKTIISFSEAAWVIAVEDRLREWLDFRKDVALCNKFTRTDEYGNASRPAYKIGYDLAYKARQILSFSQEEPIWLRKLCIDRLAIPIIQIELPDYIAGATIANNESRGIVVNIKGMNNNVWIRRATIAHELGHLLWDPDQNLERIRVDKYTELDEGWSSDRKRLDYVEQRANAFAAEFLAPKEVAARIYKRSGLRAVMEQFGVSFFLARWQVWNGLYETESFDSFSVDDIEPTDEWRGGESYTAEYFPINNVPTSRTGFFAGLVTLAEQKNLISKDTATQYLRCSEDEYDRSKNMIPGLFNLS